MDDQVFDSSSDDDNEEEFPLHDAAEAGDLVAVERLLTKEKGEEESTEKPGIDDHDPDGATALHLAVLRGHAAVVELLMKSGAQPHTDLQGSTPLHLAVCTAALPPHHAASLQIIDHLLAAGADPYSRDDLSRTPLHWAAAYDLKDVARMLLQYVEANPLPPPASGGPLEGRTPPALIELEDNQGDTPLHVAARHRRESLLALMLQLSPPKAASEAMQAANRLGHLPLHCAAAAGAGQACLLLMASAPEAVLAADKKGFTPVDLAARRGHLALADLIQSPDADPSSYPPTPAPTSTLLVAPREAWQHHTCPHPQLRGKFTPPPENVARMAALAGPGAGVLHTTEFSSLPWEQNCPRAAMSDVLRVHEWTYVRRLRDLCEHLTDAPGDLAHLDSDTAVSRASYDAALRAAGAVCMAVDRVIAGQARNAFCLVRPPGHHAGPVGVVGSPNDPGNSHGFCLLNNIAIAAAYAMGFYREKVRRVALLDFDVHHGNGTQACVLNLVPGTMRHTVVAPMCSSTFTFDTCKPWRDADDAENVMFASVQGYGSKAHAVGMVYPGTGATCDTQRMQQAAAEKQGPAPKAAPAPPAAQAAQGISAVQGVAKPLATSQLGIADTVGDTVSVMSDANDKASPCQSAMDEDTATARCPREYVEEDPKGEFEYVSGEAPPLDPLPPRIINVGIPGPGGNVGMWRRAWRDKILPAVVNFGPDLILVSAGFDAHRKDDINHRYIGVQEADYEWLTDQIQQVANRCCQGRVVSALEGGYNITGGVASPLARSVAAHVRALMEPHTQVWDPEEARMERAMEARRREQQRERDSGNRGGPVLPGARPAMSSDQPDTAASEQRPMAVTAALSEVAQRQGDDASQSRKRRRANVDYVALNAQMEGGGAGPAPGAGGGGPATASVGNAMSLEPAVSVISLMSNAGGPAQNSSEAQA